MSIWQNETFHYCLLPFFNVFERLLSSVESSEDILLINLSVLCLELLEFISKELFQVDKSALKISQSLSLSVSD
jgi:hypothetical protein